MVYSVYAGVLFGELCAPGSDTPWNTRWVLDYTIQCGQDQHVEAVRAKTTAAHLTWTMLIVFVALASLSEIVKLLTIRKKYFKSWSSARNIVVIAAIAIGQCLY